MSQVLSSKDDFKEKLVFASETNQMILFRAYGDYVEATQGEKPTVQDLVEFIRGRYPRHGKPWDYSRCQHDIWFLVHQKNLLRIVEFPENTFRYWYSIEGLFA